MLTIIVYIVKFTDFFFHWVYSDMEMLRDAVYNYNSGHGETQYHPYFTHRRSHLRTRNG